MDKKVKQMKKLLDDSDIRFSNEEHKILKITRNKRNNLIHGLKDIKVEERDLTKMRTIIEKILIAKINKIDN